MDDDAIRIPLRARDGSVRAWAIVDREDADLAELGWYVHSIRNSGLMYARYRGGKPVTLSESFSARYMHRIILWRKLGGEVGPDALTDHANGDGLDNRRSNIRPATRSQNGANRQARRKFASIYTGVVRRTDCRVSPWRAQITVNGTSIKLGCFADEADAARAYDRAAREYHGEYARLNFPDGDA